jgi:hypothetical protein
VGRLALEQMTARIKKWRARREKEGGVRLARVGGALEMVHNERAECELHQTRRVFADMQLTLSTTMRSRSTSNHYTSVYIYTMR